MKKVIVKNNICIKDESLTCNSKIIENYISPYDATLIENVKKAGYEFTSTIDMDEFGVGFSQSGTIKAVKEGIADIAIDSDADGNMRVHATKNGLIAIKPTFGLVSRYGVVTTAGSLEQVGVVANNVDDTAQMLGVIASYDQKDSSSANIDKKDYTNINKNISGLKIGILKGTKEKMQNNLAELEAKGAEVLEIDFAEFDYVFPVWYMISSSELCSNLGRYDGIRFGIRTKNHTNLKEIYTKSRGEGFGDEVKRRTLFGTFFLSDGRREEYYRKANKVRTVIKRKLEEIFNNVDIILTPAVYEENKLDEKASAKIYEQGSYAMIANLGGYPAIVANNVQAIGKHFEEEMLFNVVAAIMEEVK